MKTTYRLKADKSVILIVVLLIAASYIFPNISDGHIIGGLIGVGFAGIYLEKVSS